MTVLRNNKFSVACNSTILAILTHSIIQTSCAGPRVLSHPDVSDPGLHYPKVHQTWHPAYSENTLSAPPESHAHKPPYYCRRTISANVSESVSR